MHARAHGYPNTDTHIGTQPIHTARAQKPRCADTQTPTNTLTLKHIHTSARGNPGARVPKHRHTHRHSNTYTRAYARAGRTCTQTPTRTLTLIHIHTHKQMRASAGARVRHHVHRRTFPRPHLPHLPHLRAQTILMPALGLLVRGMMVISLIVCAGAWLGGWAGG